MKKCKLINIIIVTIILIADIICAVNSINKNQLETLNTNIVLVFLLLCPIIIEKIFKVKFKWYIKTTIYIFIFLAQFIGCVLNLYRTVNWYDNFVHGLSGTLTAIGAILFFNTIFNNRKVNKWFVLFYLLGSVSLVITIWEIIEYTSDVLFDTDLQYYKEIGVNDTMQDIISATIGGLLIVMPYFLEKRTGIVHETLNKIDVL